MPFLEASNEHVTQHADTGHREEDAKTHDHLVQNIAVMIAGEDKSDSEQPNENADQKQLPISTRLRWQRGNSGHWWSVTEGTGAIKGDANLYLRFPLFAFVILHHIRRDSRFPPSDLPAARAERLVQIQLGGGSFRPQVITERTASLDVLLHRLLLLLALRLIHQIEPARRPLDRPVSQQRIEIVRAVLPHEAASPWPSLGGF